MNDGILVCLWEDTFTSGALNIERKHAERGNLGPLALGWVADQLIPRNVDFDLAGCDGGTVAERIFSWGELDPIAAQHRGIHHEADIELEVCFISFVSLGE